MTPLSDALTAAQRSALAALEKAYVAERIDSEEAAARMKACGISDEVDISFLLTSLDVLKEWGVAAPTMAERVAEVKVEKMTGKQREYLMKLAAEKNVHLRPGFEGLSKAQASAAIEDLQAGVYDEEKDVPF